MIANGQKAQGRQIGGIPRGSRQPVGGDLFENENIVRFVVIETADENQANKDSFSGSPNRVPKMSNNEFAKGECDHCQGHLEFPAEAVGRTAPCPHCGQPTELRPLISPKKPGNIGSKAN